MKPLTADEIAELRRVAGHPLTGDLDDLRDTLPRLLDEVEQSRKRQVDHVTVMDIAHRHAGDLKAQIERHRALLKRIEWMGSAYPDASDMPCCPACDSQHKHAPDCELAAQLGP